MHPTPYISCSVCPFFTLFSHGKILLQAVAVVFRSTVNSGFLCSLKLSDATFDRPLFLGACEGMLSLIWDGL